MFVKSGRAGEFWGCSKFPECKHTESVKGPPRPVTSEDSNDALNSMAKALAYIRDQGGVSAARAWLDVACDALAAAGRSNHRDDDDSVKGGGDDGDVGGADA
jgi:ssDNA-binding Zn-finger/Zn-ribbon topoisomerase 1